MILEDYLSLSSVSCNFSILFLPCTGLVCGFPSLTNASFSRFSNFVLSMESSEIFLAKEELEAARHAAETITLSLQNVDIDQHEAYSFVPPVVNVAESWLSHNHSFPCLSLQ